MFSFGKTVADRGSEQWLPVVGYESRYEVSDLGRVRSALSGRVLSPGVRKNGYLQVTLHGVDGSKATLLVHRIVARAFIGEVPPGMQVDHCDCVRKNNELANLRYATRSDNNARRWMPRVGGARSSGFRGVTRSRNLKSFAATIRIGGRKTHLGTFATAEEAALAYNAAAIRSQGKHAALNDIGTEAVS